MKIKFFVFLRMLILIFAEISVVLLCMLPAGISSSVFSQPVRDTVALKNKSADDWTAIYLILCFGILLYLFFIWMERISKRRYFERIKHKQEFERKMRLADIRLERKRREFEEGFINYFERLLWESMQSVNSFKVKSSKDKNELKYLFRDLALKYHPDKSRNENERELFEFLMKKINLAYASEDLSALKQIDKLYEEHKNEIS